MMLYHLNLCITNIRYPPPPPQIKELDLKYQYIDFVKC